MHILGFQIKRAVKTEVVKDQIPTVKVTIPDTKKPALMQKGRDPVLGYHSDRSIGSGDFESSESEPA